MPFRSVKQVHSAVRDDIADLVTRRALPTSSIGIVDPFLFLNHHGPQVYPRNNLGLPFGPHPHRGFETVTFILEGDLAHEDSGGHSSVIKAGGVQWMTAGRGLVHSEISSKEFLAAGGPLEILQLWVNLPARLKMTEPRYRGLQAPQIPTVVRDAVRAHVVSGSFGGTTGPFEPLYDLRLVRLEWERAGEWRIDIARERNVFFYVIRGDARVNEREVSYFHLAEFAADGETIHVSATEGTQILLGDTFPFGEPVVSYGPFVMNTKEEIRQAMLDYERGLFD